MTLTGLLNHLLTTSKAPHFVQIHAGPIEEDILKKFVSENHLVRLQCEAIDFSTMIRRMSDEESEIWRA